MNSLAKIIFCYSLLLTNCVGDVWGKTYVVIRNNLQAENTLTVHCQSKDDDLEVHDITSNCSWNSPFNLISLGGRCSFAVLPGRVNLSGLIYVCT